MADPLVRLDTQRASVQPGGQAQVMVTVTNPGTVVEGYQVLALGAGGAWAQVLPAELSVYPQQEATATVVFSPPSGAGAPGGTIPFGVLVRSTLDPRTSAVAEGELEVGEVFGLQAKLVPVTSAGRWRGRHVLQVANSGNTAATLRFRASDPDDALGFYLQPEIVELPAGGRTSVRMSVRTKHPFLRGTPVRLPFQVVGEPLDAGDAVPAATPYGDPSRPVADGALSQKAILSKTFITLATLLVLGVVGLGAYLLLRQTADLKIVVTPLAPETPAQFAVTATAPDGVTLSWAPADFIDKYHQLSIDPKTNATFDSKELPGALSQVPLTGLQPATEYCFQLTATRGTATSPPTARTCATTGAAPASPSPSPSASPSSPSPAASTPGGGGASSASASASVSVVPGDPVTDPIMRQHWILMVDRKPVDTADEDEVGAIASTVQLDTGVDTAYLETTTYPRLLVHGTPVTPGVTPPAEWMVYLTTTYLTPEEAEATCPAVQKSTGGTAVCLAVQPDPPQ
jgi:hypothetical protein